MNKKEKKETRFIGDGGMVERPDNISKSYIVLCTILGLFLIFLGIMAVTY